VKFDKLQYASYKLSDSSQRMAAMHWNEMINVKARFETLYKTRVDDIVVDDQGRKVTLEDFILRIMYKDYRMFLVIEQGVGKAARHTHVILNPKVKNKAKEWLVREYSALVFELGNKKETLVDKEKFEQYAQYNQHLKEFLGPRLQTEEARKVKKFNRKIKSYAQVLGL